MDFRVLNASGSSFIGKYAGQKNLGTNVTGIGFLSLSNNSSGYGNTATGANSLKDNTSGYLCTAFGAHASSANTTGYENTAIGNSALKNNTTGIGLTAVGRRALESNKTGSRATAVGYQSQYYYSDSTVSHDAYNTSLGYQALRGYAVASQDTGRYNTAIGDSALIADSSGSWNVALGYNAGSTNTRGDKNTFIGTEAVNASASDNNAIVIGYGATGNGTNTTTFGNSSTTMTYIPYGGLAVDTPTFVVDAVNNRGGFGTSTPATLLNLSAATGSAILQINQTTNTNRLQIENNAAGGYNFYGDGNVPMNFYTNGTNRVIIAGGGNVGIGLSPSYQLELSTNSAGKPTSEHWTVVSDRRLKEDIADISDPLSKLLSLRGRTYKWKSSEKARQGADTKIGFIAQEVETAFPAWVGTTADGTKNITTAGMDALIVESIRTLKNEIDALKLENSDLKKRIEKLEGK
jgi:hypothetical protein